MPLLTNAAYARAESIGREKSISGSPFQMKPLQARTYVTGIEEEGGGEMLSLLLLLAEEEGLVVVAPLDDAIGASMKAGTLVKYDQTIGLSFSSDPLPPS